MFSKEEIGRLLDVTRNLKHKAIICMTYSAGLRKSEVLNLRIGDIDSDRMQVLIRSGKGKKTRYSLLGQRTLDLLREYYRKYRPHDFLFPGQIHSKPLSERTVEVVFKQAMKLARINKPAYFYCFAGPNGGFMAAWLSVLGYNAKFIPYGANGMVHTAMKATATANTWGVGSDISRDLPIVTN